MTQLEKKSIIKDDSIKVLFLGAVHGNEKCGTMAIRKVINMFEIGDLALNKGSLMFMPICNPKAYEENTRDVGINLNRVIDLYKEPKVYEEEIANQIAEEIAKADYVVDLHSSYTDDAPFAFLDYDSEENRMLVEATLAHYVICGFPQLYKASGLVEMSTGTFANTKTNSHSTTVECGNHYKEESGQFATQVILNTLKQLGLINGNVIPDNEAIYINVEKIVLKGSEGSLMKEYQNFDAINEGEVIAEYKDGSKIASDKDCIIILPNVDAKIGAEWFYLGSVSK